jgi:hypothetical protein
MQKKKESLQSRLIGFEEAGKLIGINANTLRQRKAGTEMLTHVRGFGRRIFLIRSEVEELIDNKINQALAEDRQRKKFMIGS